MNRYKILLIAILIYSVIIPTVAKGAVPDASNSMIYISINEINPETTEVISVYAADGSDVAISGANVTLSCTDGKFTSNDLSIVTGITNVDGWFNTTWESPYTSFVTQELIVTFQATISDDLPDIILEENITVKHLDNSYISDSELFVPSEVFSGEIIDFSTQVRDSGVNPSSGMQVTYSLTDGEYLSSSQGLSDSLGFFNASWKAPVLDQFTPNTNVTITALVEASGEVNLSLVKNITVLLSNATELTVTVFAPNEVTSGTITPLLLSVFANTSPASGGTVTLTTDSGLFNNSDVAIVLSINNSGYVDFEWTAPTVTSNQSVTISIAAEYLLITTIDITEFSITVYPIIRNFTIAWDHLTDLDQNQEMNVTLTVRDADNNTLLSGADVTLLLDLGKWLCSNDSTVTVKTDMSGEISVTFNAYDTVLLLQENIVNISVSVTMNSYNEYQGASNFTLTRVTVYEFNATASKLSILQGESVVLTLRAYRAQSPWVNASFYLTTSAGQFDGGDLSLRSKTDSNGVLIVNWDSSSIPTLMEAVDVFIIIDLVNSGLETISITITVNPVSDGTTTTSGTNPLGDIIPIAIGGLLVLVVVGVGVIFVRRR